MATEAACQKTTRCGHPNATVGTPMRHPKALARRTVEAAAATGTRSKQYWSSQCQRLEPQKLQEVNTTSIENFQDFPVERQYVCTLLRLDAMPAFERFLDGGRGLSQQAAGSKDSHKNAAMPKLASCATFLRHIGTKLVAQHNKTMLTRIHGKVWMSTQAMCNQELCHRMSQLPSNLLGKPAPGAASSARNMSSCSTHPGKATAIPPAAPT